ncbi:hypothetical protein N0V82_006533 [Gnomoniopsis sp. IMI 355080]|nr:hypothetical protein N0V82_006533 [Gnomoniopsis sp. IMI 355080]
MTTQHQLLRQSSSRAEHALDRTKICEAPIRFLLQLFDAPEGIRELPLLPKQSRTSERSWFGLQSDGKLFAILSKKLSLGLHDLLDKADVEFQAVIDLKEMEHKTASLKRRQVASTTIDVNIYGHKNDAELTGNILSSLGLYLQQPILQRDGTRYYNPHFFHMDEISETPTFELDVGVGGSQLRLNNASHDANPNANDSTDTGQDSGEDVSSILDSLTQSTVIGKRAGDIGLITLLKEYEHKIMGTERLEPRDIQGGLIADEMGLGKTMIMLANIVGSLKRAQAFVATESQQPRLSSGRRRSKATLVVVPSSSM